MVHIVVGGHFEIQDGGRFTNGKKNVTNGFLAQNSIIFQKNTTFPFIGKKITNPNFATIQHIILCC